MHYPDSFKTRCREVYPDWDDLHRLVEAGNTFAGRYLDDASQGGISPEEVLACKNPMVLVDKAEWLKAKKDLYSEWGRLYDQEFGSSKY